MSYGRHVETRFLEPTKRSTERFFSTPAEKGFQNKSKSYMNTKGVPYPYV